MSVYVYWLIFFFADFFFLLLDEDLISGALQPSAQTLRVVYCPTHVLTQHGRLSEGITVDTIFSSLTARFLIEALGRGELGGALAAPAGWQR